MTPPPCQCGHPNTTHRWGHNPDTHGTCTQCPCTSYRYEETSR